MSFRPPFADSLLALLAWATRVRYIKFGIVGASGTAVNIAVLYLAQNYLFSDIEPAKLRLPVSLALAILIATANNFTWNRLWTWADREQAALRGAPQVAPAAGEASTALATPLAGRLIVQFGRYCMASWFGMAFQFGMTIWLDHYMDYRVANIVSIILASVINFLANDRWTFRRRKAGTAQDRVAPQ